MFDELDDPAFPGPGPGARERVAARATRIRRNRQAGWALGLASVVALAAAVAVGLGRPLGAEPVQPAASASPTPAESPTPTPSVTPSPTRTTPKRGQVGGGLPTPIAPPASSAATRAEDLVGGWLGLDWIQACRPATALAEARTDDPGLSLRLEAPELMDANEPGTARLVLTNTTSEGYWVQFAGSEAGAVVPVLAGDDGTFSGLPWREHADRENPNLLSADLAAGESQAFDVPILLDTCAPERTVDAPGTPRPLAPGTYRMAVTIWVTDSLYFAGASPASPTESPTSPPADGRGRSLYSTEAVTVTVR